MLSKLEDYLNAFDAVQRLGLEAVLVGGQACNFYAYKYAEKDIELMKFRPFTSKDVDLFTGDKEGVILAKELNGKWVQSPHKGGMMGLTFGKIILPNGHTIEIMGKINGIKSSDLSHGIIQADFGGKELKILHPVLLYESKGHNLIDLDQTGRQDEKHFRIMSLVLPHYLNSLAVNNLSEKDLIYSLERLQSFSLSTTGVKLARQGYPTPYNIIKASRHSEWRGKKVDKWKKIRLPQWEKELKDRHILD